MREAEVEVEPLVLRVPARGPREVFGRRAEVPPLGAQQADVVVGGGDYLF